MRLAEICLRDFRRMFPEETEFLEKCKDLNLDDAAVVVLDDEKPPSILVDDENRILRFR